MCMLADPRIWTEDEAPAHILSFKSAIIRRVCKSTMAAETQALGNGTDEAHRVRAILADMHNSLNLADWETSSAVTRKCLW